MCTMFGHENLLQWYFHPQVFDRFSQSKRNILKVMFGCYRHEIVKILHGPTKKQLCTVLQKQRRFLEY